MVPHLEQLCSDAGANEVNGTALDLSRVDDVGNSLLDKLRVAMRQEQSANLFFLHRDSDERDHRPRRRQIHAAIDANSPSVPCVAVVPVQETEAWLLLDETAIRRAAANPRGRVSLNLPLPSAVERLARPKEFLQGTLITASEHTGRHLDRFKAQFGTQRRTLLEQLPIGGPLEQVDSWIRLRADIRAALAPKITIEN